MSKDYGKVEEDFDNCCYGNHFVCAVFADHRCKEVWGDSGADMAVYDYILHFCSK
jgi:hypothetical protein